MARIVLVKKSLDYLLYVKSHFNTFVIFLCLLLVIYHAVTGGRVGGRAVRGGAGRGEVEWGLWLQDPSTRTDRA